MVGVTDGDTLTLLDSARTRYKVRLAGIDAPEMDQPFGQRSKRELSRIAFGTDVVVVTTKRDRYGRVVGKVIVNGTDVGLRQIEQGLAWHYKEYMREQAKADRDVYAAAEERARGSGIGLWADNAPTPPWEWRHR